MYYIEIFTEEGRFVEGKIIKDFLSSKNISVWKLMSRAIADSKIMATGWLKSVKCTMHARCTIATYVPNKTIGRGGPKSRIELRNGGLSGVRTMQTPLPGKPLPAWCKEIKIYLYTRPKIAASYIRINEQKLPGQLSCMSSLRYLLGVYLCVYHHITQVEM